MSSVRLHFKDCRCGSCSVELQKPGPLLPLPPEPEGSHTITVSIFDWERSAFGLGVQPSTADDFQAEASRINAELTKSAPKEGSLKD